MERNLSIFINKIVETDLFRKANFYFRCMKVPSHSRVVNFNFPNSIVKNHTSDVYWMFTKSPNKIPYFLTSLVDYAYQEFQKIEIDIERVCHLCFKDNLYLGQFLAPKKEYEVQFNSGTLVSNILEYGLKFQKFFELNYRNLIYVLIAFLINENKVEINGIEDIKGHELLRKDSNKYGLSNLNNAKFCRQGFILDKRYYLYNIFFDTSIGPINDSVPITIKIINDEIKNKNFFMRCDGNLSIPENDILSKESIFFMKYRGINLNFNTINRIVFKKEIIVHIKQDGGEKLLMIVKKVKDNEHFSHYDIVIEGLWNPKSINDSYVLTNFVHAKYYPERNGFDHIDYSVNQYPKNIYINKYKDCSNETKTPIDKYAEIHYKIWCVESDNIKINTWIKLIYCTLADPFKSLLSEILEEHTDLP